MAYIYQADLWCDACGSQICEDLVKGGKAQEIIPWDSLANDSQTTESNLAQLTRARVANLPDDLAWMWNHFQLDPRYSGCELNENEYDSDDYPKYGYDDDAEHDSVHHCASGAECLDAVRLDDGTKIGALLTDRLTREGQEQFLSDLKSREEEKGIGEPSPVVLYWMDHVAGCDLPKDFYEVKLENSDDDPTHITATVRGTYAEKWADGDSSIEGSSWETCDGADFVYAIIYDRPGLVEALQAEGYSLDLSEYSECTSEEFAIIAHASECPACQYDYSKAETHLAKQAKASEAFRQKAHQWFLSPACKVATLEALGQCRLPHVR